MGVYVCLCVFLCESLSLTPPPIPTQIQIERLKKLLAAGGGDAKPSFAELTKNVDNTAFKRPMDSAGTQTEVDDDGIWDKQDGWTLPISGTCLRLHAYIYVCIFCVCLSLSLSVSFTLALTPDPLYIITIPTIGTRIARYRWRQAIQFSQCPSCHGIGAFIALAAKLLKIMQRGGGNQLVDESRKPRGKTGAVWQIPDELVRIYMCMCLCLSPPLLHPLTPASLYYTGTIHVQPSSQCYGYFPKANCMGC